MKTYWYTFALIMMGQHTQAVKNSSDTSVKTEGTRPSIIESLTSKGYTLKPDQSTILVGYLPLPNNDGGVTVTPYYRHIPAGSKQPISAQTFSTVTL